MNALNITKQLISIPSYVDGSVDEQKIGQFVFDYLKNIPWLTVKKQKVEKGRFNIVAYDKYPTKILLCNHLDTVKIQSGWKENPTTPIEKSGKLYGLGSSDSKGNVAALISAIENSGPTKGLMLLLYVDEEYQLKGMDKFTKAYKNELRSLKIVGCADGCDEELGNSCRGIIEVLFVVQGIAGHAANPSNGKNAIRGALKAIDNLEEKLNVFETKELGKPTINVSWIAGGDKISPNIIPSTAEFVLEIRNPNPSLTPEKVANLYKAELLKLGLILENFEVRFNLGAWITEKRKLKEVEGLVSKVKYSDAKLDGYSDIQLLWERFNQPTCFVYGIGNGKTIHKPNEYITIKNLEKGVKFWTAFIRENC